MTQLTLLIRNLLLVDHTLPSDYDDLPVVDRVCWVSPLENLVGLIQVTCISAYPRIEMLSDVENQLKAGERRVLGTDGWAARPIVVEKTDNEREAAKKRRQCAQTARLFKKLRFLFEDHERELFDSDARGRLLRAQVKAGLGTEPFLRKHIRRYYQYGMCQAALHRRYEKCGKKNGVKGQAHEAGAKKRGRPCSAKNRSPEAVGINIVGNYRKRLEEAWDKFKVKENLSLKSAYAKTLEVYFSDGYRIEAGIVLPILPPLETLPTEGQFQYWGQRGRNPRKDKLRAVAVKDYNLNHRGLTGSARHGVTGPAAQFQVDATKSLVYLVARASPVTRIGTAILYGVEDTYSQLVVGWVLCLENAQYGVFAVALERAFTDKREYLERLGIPIEWSDWPSAITPDEVLGDHGPELMGHQSDHIASALQVQLTNTGVGRADWKPYIERLFGHTKGALRDIPGAIPRKPRRRGEPDVRNAACLTLNDLEKLIVRYFLHFNHTHDMSKHPDAVHLLAEGLLPTPINLWEWGRKHRSGAGRAHDPERVRAAVMPKATVPATGEGLAFQGLRYGSKRLSEDGAFLRRTGLKHAKYRVAYDPRDLSEIWLLDDQYRLIERCPLTPKYAHRAGMSLWELQELDKQAAPIRSQRKRSALERDAGYQRFKKNTVKEAKDRQQAYGSSTPVYDEDEAFAEKAERRSETAWTRVDPEPNQQTSAPYLTYVPGPTYDDDDSQAEAVR